MWKGQSFGDGGAAQGLEVVVLQFVCAIAVLAVAKFILEFVQYSDNLMYSFKSKSEYLEVKKDLEASFEKYSMPLKYYIRNQKHDPEVLNQDLRNSWVFIGIW